MPWLSLKTSKSDASYDEKSETWYFSVVDIIAALIQQPDYQAARNYWKVLKESPEEGRQRVGYKM